MGYKLSVVIPVYNAENTLKKAIESILSQNWEGNLLQDIEVILIDDNSHDNSLDIIKYYCEKYENFRYYGFSNNSGFGGRGRNKGIELSNAEFIILMDNDDIYLQNAFQTMYDVIIEENADLASFNFKISIFEDKRIHCPKKYGEKILVNPTITQDVFDIVSTSGSYAPWAKIYRKEFLIKNNIKFIEDSQFDDADFFIKCILATKKYAIRPMEKVYMYFTYESSQVRLHDKIHFDARLNSLKNIDKMIEKHNLSSEAFVNHCFADFLLIFSNTHETKENKLKMLEDLYNFEKKFSIDLKKFELNFLNKLILNHNFNIAILVSNIYSKMYNNDIIKSLYRKRNFNNRFKGD